MQALLDLVRRHKAGQPVGITSVCSAHPVVLRAALREAQSRGVPALVEATSNQVNQYGGYTGMTPAAFHAFVMGLADEAGVPREQVLLGGDHLGPNAWRTEASELALGKAEAMVAQYVEAGFRKIHLDCSMACADDPHDVPERLVAARAARLAEAAERAWSRVGGEAPVYVIGTEVPVPGGAHEALQELEVTRPASAAATIAAHREAFERRALGAAWSRVIGLVVQPGVEFDHHKVIDYAPAKARALSAYIEHEPALVYEAHSTDYQTPAALAALVRDHFAILKIGPAATFALRETLWGLADIEAEWLPDAARAGLKQVVMKVMQAAPEHWRAYYADPERLKLDLQYSLSDRVRYYWAHPRVQAACDALLQRLDRGPLPLTLLSQYLPWQYERVRAGRLRNAVGDLLQEGVARVLRQYADACLPAPARRPQEALQ